VHFGRVGYNLQRWSILWKGGVNFATVGYTVKECSRSEHYRFHSKPEAAG